MQEIKGVVLWLLVCVAPLLLTTRSVAQSPELTVLVHESVDTTSLTASQLRQIYSLRKTVWPDGQTITLFVLPSNDPIHQRFCKEELGMFPYQLERIWENFVFSGIAEHPTVVRDQQTMLQKIAQTPGAIGYVSGPGPAGSTAIQVVREEP